MRIGESAIEAARREVSEETGCNVHVEEFAGTTHYLVGGIPKSVFYFVMKAETKDRCEPKDTKEIESAEWLTPADAHLALTHREERILISAVFGIRQ
jgi:8-oxo-dGTP diphosphatase